MAYGDSVSYLIVAVLYAVISGLLLVSAGRNRIGRLLIGACVASAIWALLLAYNAASDGLGALPIFTVEVIRFGFWTMFLSALIKGQGVRNSILSIVSWFWLLVLAGGIASLAYHPEVSNRSFSIGNVLAYGGLLLALFGLVLLEQLYRNATLPSRSNLKILVIALGGMFAYDLFLYSQAVLFHGFDLSVWKARGIVNILFVPMIAVAARRNPDWDLDIFISRQVVFYSSSLVAVGLYLVAMSAGGYYILLYGGNWGAIARVVFFVGAILILVTLLFSSVVRAQVKVFLSKHFFRNKYDYREEWLRLVSTLAEFEDGSTRKVMIKALAQIVHSPGGVLWVLEENDAEFKLADSYGERFKVPNIRMDDPLISFIETKNWLVDIDEFRRNPDIYENIRLNTWLMENRHAWLIVPLLTRGKLVGIVLLGRAKVATSLNYEDRDLLKTVGHHIAVHLAQEKSDSLLAEAQQFEAYNRLTAFLMHDLNNLIAQQSLIVKNAERHKRNPEFVDDAMSTIANSVSRMRRVMEQIKRRDSEPLPKKTVLKFILSSAVDRCADRKPLPRLDISVADLPISVDVEKFVTVLSHLIKNAQDATPENGTILVSSNIADGKIKIVVADSGSGMDPEFVRDRLFRPFDSTKGSQGMGIGAYQAREFARSLGGDLVVESTQGVGSTMTMSLPEAALRSEL